MGRLRRPPTEYDLALHQADQARSDFAVIEDGLEFIMAQISKVPKRRELAWVAAGSFAGGAARNPRLVYAGSPAGGQEGPLAQPPGTISTTSRSPVRHTPSGGAASRRPRP